MTRKPMRGEFTIAVAVAFALAIGSSLALSQMVVGSVNPWLVIGVSVVGAALAAGNPENIVEAFIISVLFSGTCVTALLTLPLSPVWQQVVVAACSGLCTTKIALGVYCDFLKPPVIYHDPGWEGAGARRTELAARGEQSKDPDGRPKQAGIAFERPTGHRPRSKPQRRQHGQRQREAQQVGRRLALAPRSRTAITTNYIEANRAFVTNYAAQYTAMFERVADAANLPTLIHCTAGKDRAGFGAALLLLALGVPEATVFEDYLLTNYYTRDVTESTLTMIRLISLFRSHPDEVRPLFAARTEYLQAAFDAIDVKFGSVDAYLREGLGVTDAVRERLRATLLR